MKDQLSESSTMNINVMRMSEWLNKLIKRSGRFT
jgi:hypothetical protein